MLHNNIIATVITFVIALSWLRLMDFFAHKGMIESKLSRKIIHIGTGPIFVLCWLLFDDQYSARFLAALVPFATTIQFALVGLGILKDEAAVKAMSRSGVRQEILRGPLFYGIVFVILTIIFWKDNMIGIISLMILCGGDGLADVIGKRIPSKLLPWSKNKTWAGTSAMFLGGFILSSVILWIFSLAGVFQISWSFLFPRLILINLIATIIEALPISDFDNLTVPVATVLASLLLL